MIYIYVLLQKITFCGFIQSFHIALIFRGLDALSTEEKLLAAINQAASVTVKNIRIIRDPLTNTSRGYGFAEMSSIQESTQLLDTLTNMSPSFELDGKLILVSFAKNTFNTV